MIELMISVTALTVMLIYVYFKGRFQAPDVTPYDIKQKEAKAVKQAKKKALKVWGNDYPPRSMTATEAQWYALYKNFRHYNEIDFLITLNIPKNGLEETTTPGT